MASKFLNSRNLMIAVSVLLIAALVTGLVLVTAPEDDMAEGTIDAASVLPAGRVNYSIETEGTFRRYVSQFLEIMSEAMMDLLFEESAPHEITFRNSAAVSDVMLEIFARAAVPSEKLLKFGEFLTTLDGDKAATDIFFFFIEVEEVVGEDGTVKYYGKLASPAKLMTAFTGGIDFGNAVESVVAATALTNEEFARLFYETVYNFSDGERKEMLEKTGRTRFVNIFVALSTVYESYITFSVSGGTLAAARTAAELMYETGAELTSLIEEAGADAVLTAIGFGGERFDNGELTDFLVSAGIDPAELAGAEAVNDVLNSGGKIAEFLLYAAAAGLTATDNVLFESLARAYEATDGKEKTDWTYLHYIRLASAAAAGAEAGFASSAIKDVDSFASTFAELGVCMEALDTPFADDAARQARKNELVSVYSEYVSVITAMRDRFGSVTDINGVRALGAEDRALLAEYTEYLENFDYEALLTGGNDFVGTVALNIIFNFISDMLKEALDSVSSVG